MHNHAQLTRSMLASHPKISSFSAPPSSPPFPPSHGWSSSAGTNRLWLPRAKTGGIGGAVGRGGSFPDGAGAIVGREVTAARGAACVAAAVEATSVRWPETAAALRALGWGWGWTESRHDAGADPVTGTGVGASAGDGRTDACRLGPGLGAAGGGAALACRCRLRFPT